MKEQTLTVLPSSISCSILELSGKLVVSVLASPAGAGSSPVNRLTTSTVAAGPCLLDQLPTLAHGEHDRKSEARTPGSAANTFPSLSTTNTPLVVPFGAFFIPIAAIKVAAGSQSSAYGRLCLVLKVVFDFGESVERPYIDSPVAVNCEYPSLKRQT